MTFGFVFIISHLRQYGLQRHTPSAGNEANDDDDDDADDSLNVSENVRRSNEVAVDVQPLAPSKRNTGVSKKPIAEGLLRAEFPSPDVLRLGKGFRFGHFWRVFKSRFS